MPATPLFYVTPRQRLSAGAFFLAVVIAVGCLFAVTNALRHTHRGSMSRNEAAGAQLGAAGVSAGTSGDDADDEDDPSRIDTIYLGGPDQAPTATRPGGHASAVHPFIVVQLPRTGDQIGQIPDTPSGRLLYAWLAAFNGTDPAALPEALPSLEPENTEAAQLELRKATGGFTLMAAKEIAPGVLVFRMHDQTPTLGEVLGTLRMDPNQRPARIASFSLRAVLPAVQAAR